MSSTPDSADQVQRDPAATMRAEWLTGAALAAIAVLCFSLRPVLIKLAYAAGGEPVTLLTLRMVLALPGFAIAAAIATRRSTVALTRADWRAILLLAFFGYYLASFLDFLGLQYVNAGIGRLLLFLYPTMVVVIGWVWLRRRSTGRELAALALTYGGVAVVMLAAAPGQNPNLPLGAALLLACALSYAIYLTGAAALTRRLGAVRFASITSAVATLIVIAQFLVLRPLSALKVSGTVLGLAATIAVVSTVLPILLTAEALRRIGAAPVAIIGGLGPVGAIALGAVLLGERLDPVQWLGAALILGGVLLVTLGPRSQRVGAAAGAATRAATGAASGVGGAGAAT